jgi:hypothetical protein
MLAQRAAQRAQLGPPPDKDARQDQPAQIAIDFRSF